jgi:hypothetical protein
MMTKKIIIICLITYSLFAVSFNASAIKKSKYDQAVKTTENKSVFHYCLLYIPNRVVDFWDMFSFNVNIGKNFTMEMQATRIAQFGVSNGKSSFFTKGYSRQFGCGRKISYRFACSYAEKDVTTVDETSGSVRDYDIYFPDFLTVNPRLKAFVDKDVDFWKVGGNFSIFIGGGFGIHPIEVADFFTGLVGVDISEDDF